MRVSKRGIKKYKQKVSYPNPIIIPDIKLNIVLKISHKKVYLFSYLPINFIANIFRGNGSSMLKTAVIVEEDELLAVQLNGSYARK